MPARGRLRATPAPGLPAPEASPAPPHHGSPRSPLSTVARRGRPAADALGKVGCRREQQREPQAGARQETFGRLSAARLVFVVLAAGGRHELIGVRRGKGGAGRRVRDGGGGVRLKGPQPPRPPSPTASRVFAEVPARPPAVSPIIASNSCISSSASIMPLQRSCAMTSGALKTSGARAPSSAALSSAAIASSDCSGRSQKRKHILSLISFQRCCTLRTTRPSSGSFSACISVERCSIQIMEVEQGCSRKMGLPTMVAPR